MPRTPVPRVGESWTGIGVVAGFGAVVLIMQWPYGRNSDVTWGSELLQRLQKVRANCKTRNQLRICSLSWVVKPCSRHGMGVRRSYFPRNRPCFRPAEASTSGGDRIFTAQCRCKRTAGPYTTPHGVWSHVQFWRACLNGGSSPGPGGR